MLFSRRAVRQKSPIFLSVGHGEAYDRGRRNNAMASFRFYSPHILLGCMRMWGRLDQKDLFISARIPAMSKTHFLLEAPPLLYLDALPAAAAEKFGCPNPFTPSYPAKLEQVKGLLPTTNAMTDVGLLNVAIGICGGTACQRAK